MSNVRLPEGGKAWFVRKRHGRHCGLSPVSVEGHLLTGAYALAVTAIIIVFFGRGQVDVMEIVAMVVLFAALTFLYILTALRMSGPAQAGPRGRGKCS